MDILGITVNCGTIVIKECKDMNMPWGEEWAFQALLGEILDQTTVLMNFGLDYAGGLSPNITRALNAFRCAINNLGNNAWNFIAAVYWTLVGVGQEGTANEYLDIGYEWICTCGKDVEGLLASLGSGGGDNSNDPYAGACSEKAAVNKSNAQEDRDQKRQAELDAKAQAEAEEEAAKKAAETRDALLGKSAGELEAAQLDAFEAYQAKAEELAAKDAPSDSDKEELEELRRAYEATKTAKANIVRDGLLQQLWDAKNQDGLDGLRAVVSAASANQLSLAKKSQEFPDDITYANDLGAAEDSLKLTRDALLEMANSIDVSVRESDGIKDIANSAQAAEAYNRLFAEALPIARSGDTDILDIFFEAIEQQLADAEREYNWAVDQKKADAVERGVVFKLALVDYTQSLDVRFDVVEAADQESLLPEVVLDEDEEDALAFPVDSARQTEGGQDQVVTRMKQLYDAILRADAAYASSDEDLELANVLARAYEEYRWTKQYAADTYVEQVGLSEEERAEIQRQQEAEASGDDGIAVVEVDPEAAAALEAEIAAQRAEEQRIKQELVAAAEAELLAA